MKLDDKSFCRPHLNVDENAQPAAREVLDQDLRPPRLARHEGRNELGDQRGFGPNPQSGRSPTFCKRRIRVAPLLKEVSHLRWQDDQQLFLVERGIQLSTRPQSSER